MIAIVAAPHDELLRRFVGDLKRRGLPDSRVAHADRYRIGEAEVEVTSYAALSPVPTSSWTCED